MPLLRTCDGCLTKLPPYKPRTRSGEQMLCDGCHPSRSGRSGQPLDVHAALGCQACDAPLGEAGLIITAGLLRCAEGCTAAKAPEITTVEVWADLPGDNQASRILSMPLSLGDQDGRDAGARKVERVVARYQDNPDNGDNYEIRLGNARYTPQVFLDHLRNNTPLVTKTGSQYTAYVGDESFDHKKDRPLTGEQAVPISTLLAGVQQCSIDNAPFAAALHDWQGTSSDMTVPKFLKERKSLWDKLPRQTVSLGEKFTVTQPNVNMTRVQQIIDHPSTAGPSAPWLVRFGGRLFVIDGHHRMVADCLGHERTMEAKVLDLDHKTAHLIKQAHDSGDGQTLAHCPFCGAGGLVARSDGTTECGFCQNCFTVQVQPTHAAQPQTDPATGQPIPMPGMPGDPAAHEPAPPVAGPIIPSPAPSEVAPFAPEGAGGPDGFAPEGTDGGRFLPAGSGAEQPAEQKAAMYLNAAGFALSEQAYLAHLALLVADDSEAVLAQVRTRRGTR